MLRTFTIVSVLILTLTLAGCSFLGVGAGRPDLHNPVKQPYRAALYVSPDFDLAPAAISIDGGGSAEIPVADYVRAELLRATGRAFKSVVAIPDGAYDGPTDQPREDLEIWPDTEERQPYPPDLVVACFPADLSGHVLSGGSCAACADRLSFRAEIYFEIRDRGGVVITTGKVAGEGVDRNGERSGLPLAVRFREAIAEAVEMMVGEYQLALMGSDVEWPEPGPMLEEPERYAEAEDDSEAS